MKTVLKRLAVLCVAFAFLTAGCGGPKTSVPAPSDDIVVVTALSDSVSIKDTEVSSFDFCSLFSVTVNGEAVEVDPAWVDASKVKSAPGPYAVTCTYQNKTDSVIVTVTETVYALTLSVPEITVKKSKVADYDFKALFSYTVDGTATEIDDAYVTSDVKAEAGEYTYTVAPPSCEAKTLAVHVEEDVAIEIVRAYRTLEIEEAELASLEPKNLFALFVEHAAVEVTDAMIDASALVGAKAGQTVSVTLTYTVGETTATATVAIRIVADADIAIAAKNVVTYPNADPIDPTTLFSIERGGVNVPVTMDMIKGEINYIEPGENTLTLTYGGKTATATVTVQRGVIIDYATADTVSVRRGTDIRTYPFAGDFVVIINGARYTSIPDSCFDVSEVNFDLTGTYTATLTILYNETPPRGLAGSITLTPVTKTITYAVTDVVCTAEAAEPVVVLPKGTTQYDPFKNVVVRINGLKQSLTTRKDYVDPITTYAETDSEIDFSDPSDQTVTVRVYAYGSVGDFEQYIEVTFVVRIESDIVLTSADRIAFVGTTLYPKDLFTLTENGEEVELADDEVTGIVNTFVPGVYVVSAEHAGLTATATVVVYEAEMRGTYRTLLTTMPPEEDDDDEGAEGWGGSYGDDFDADAYALSTDFLAPLAAADGTTRLADLVIGADGSISFNGMTASSVTGIDEHTMSIRVSGSTTTLYTLHYNDGVVVLDYDNSLLMTMGDMYRPLLYFKSDMYGLYDMVWLNSGKAHVLSDVSLRWTIEAIHARSNDGAGKDFWYGLMINLVERSGSDTVYDIRWGEVTFDGEGDPDTSTVDGKLGFTFDETHYTATVQSDGVAKVDAVVETNPFAGMTFVGTIDGAPARLVVGTAYSLYINDVLRFSAYSNDVSQMKHGGVLSDSLLHLYEADDQDFGTYSYKFSMNTADRTFTLLPRDAYFGYYVFGDDFHLFLDGYGGGKMTGGSYYIETRYTVGSGELEVFYDTFNTDFPYGDSTRFYISPLLNLLTVKESHNDSLRGAVLQNTVITDGAIVTVSSTSVPAGSDGKSRLLQGITVRTKDGELTGSDLSARVDTTAVDWNKAGFYQFTIKLQVGGKDVVTYYSVQVREAVYADSNIIGTYLRGTFNDQLALTLDRYGNATVTFRGTQYKGTLTIYDEDTTFVVKTFADNGASVVGTGVLLEKGLLQVTFSGDFNSSDYFSTTGTGSVCGDAQRTLRRFTVGGAQVYVLFASGATLGERVTVEATSQANVYKIVDSEGVWYARCDWTNGTATTGLTEVAAPSEG